LDSPASNSIGRLYAKLIEAYPISVTAVSLAMIAAALATSYLDGVRERAETAARVATVREYSDQIAKLGQAENALRDLASFVENQRKRLEAAELAVGSLRTERARLRPLVEADRRIVEALFAAQEVRNAQSQRRERIVGFGFGVATSLVASILWHVVTLLLARRRTSDGNVEGRV
jgi:hypothetical protein